MGKPYRPFSPRPERTRSGGYSRLGWEGKGENGLSVSHVVTGLVPVTPTQRRRASHHRDGRHKAGHDGGPGVQSESEAERTAKCVKWTYHDTQAL